MADISIINLTVDQVVDVLETRLIDEVIAVDELDTKARLVRAGKLQEDPTKQTGIQILVHPNYPGEPDKWPHKVAMGEEFGLSFPVGEIGGGLYFWRRYTAEIVIFNLNQRDRSIPRETTHVVLSRVEHTIRNNVGNPGPDSFGESVILTRIMESSMIEGGGIGGFSWQGKVLFQTLNSIEDGCF